MKNFITILIFSAASFPLVAQFTQGGSEKNYERYRVQKDSIVKEEQVPIKSASKTGYVSIALGLSSPTNSTSKDGMSYTEWLNSSSDFSPYQTGNMGLKSGVNFSVNGLVALNGINKHLIRNIDIGLTYSYNISTLNFDWKTIQSGSNQLVTDLFADAKYRSFKMMGMGFGPSLTIIPNPKKPDFMTDFYFRVNGVMLLGGTMEAEVTDTQNDVEYELYTENNDINFALSPTIGTMLRYKGFGFFFEANLGLTDRFDSFYGVFEYYDPNNFDTGYSTSVVNVSRKFSLNHLKIGIALVIPTDN